MFLSSVIIDVLRCVFVCAAFKSFTSKCINYIPTHTHTHHITSVIKHKRPKRKEEDELNVYLPSRQTSFHIVDLVRYLQGKG